MKLTSWPGGSLTPTSPPGGVGLLRPCQMEDVRWLKGGENSGTILGRAQHFMDISLFFVQ